MRPPVRAILRPILSLLVAAGACADRRAATAPPEPAPEPAAVRAPARAEGPDPARIAADVAFLADDARQGRAPGTEGDRQTRAHIAAALEAAGLEPLFDGAYEQPFEVTEGVAARPGAKVRFAVGDTELPVGPLAVSAAGGTKGPARLVFVGTGVAPAGPGSGVYRDLPTKKVRGAVVVALAEDPEDPHVDPAALRIGARAIAARDAGAAAFVWWDPTADEAAVAALALGRADSVGIPALACGAACNDVLRRAFRVREGSDRPKLGTVARVRAEVDAPVEPVRRTTANVGGRLAAGVEPSRGIVVLGAHHDHLGRGRPGSLAPGSRDVHNGADDNASGVAAILELSRRLAAVPAAERSFDVYVVAFGAEEMGLLGSKHFVASLDETTRGRIVAMLNFDMVGRYRPDEGLVVSGVGTADGWNALLDGVDTDLVLHRKADGYGPSDHSAFYEAEIPVLHFFTGNHADYHRPTDDADRVNVEGIVQVVALAEGVLEGLARRPALAYRKTERPRVAVRGFRVSLGTIPDYAAEVRGVRLSGVRKGGAADRAGLRAGDVIVELAGRPVDSMEAYMAAFAVLVPGKEVPVVVERDGRRVTLSIVPDPPKRRAH